MGETVEQRIEMALELKEIEPESIPINILMPIAKTPFENYHNKIDDENILRTLAIFKIGYFFPYHKENYGELAIVFH